MDITKKLEGIVSQIENASFMFGRQREGLVKALESIEAQVKINNPESIEYGKINFHIGILISEYFTKQEESINRIKLALSINSKKQFLSCNQVLKAMQVLTGVYVSRGESKEAIEEIQTTKNYLEGSTIDIDFRLGALSQIGYFYHELGKFDCALKQNLSTLNEAEIHLGPNHRDLINTTRNVAENYYCLGKLSESESYLLKAVELAKVNDEPEVIVESLYKVGFLCNEQGDFIRAKDFMNLSLEEAEKSDNSELVLFAKHNLEELVKNEVCP